MPDIAKMRTYLGVERRSTVRDSTGGQSEVWSPLAFCWGRVEALTGRELEAAQAVRSTDTHRVTVRYYPTLSAKDRFVYTDPEGTVRYYNISSVIDEDLEHDYHVCTAVEGLAVG